MRTWLLILWALICFGCASAPLVVKGGTYYVFWPTAEPDIVQIQEVKDDGWVLCNSIHEQVVYTCNLNTALFFVRVRPSPNPQSVGTVVQQ